MKASELIERLAKYINENGDCPVYMEYRFNETYIN